MLSRFHPIWVILLFTSFQISFPSLAETNNVNAKNLSKLAPRLSTNVAEFAANAANCAAVETNLQRPDKLAIIDYSLPSTEKRFWLFDLVKSKLLIEDLVAHGKNTGENQAESFSNSPGSLQSSLGIFKVGESYIGKHGKSLRLIGLEPGFNNLALERAIVIHGADYVSQDFIDLHQRLGRSFGCPALSPTNNKRVIESFSNSAGFLFSYYPDNKWLKNSNYLNNCPRSL